jgi:ABC-type multidrug transport system fused ATPase/permease subunit
VTANKDRARGTAIRTIRLVRPYPLRCLTSFGLGVAALALSVQMPLVLGRTIDTGLLGHDPYALVGGAALLLVLGLAMSIANGVRRAAGASLGTAVENGLRDRLAARLLELDLTWHRPRPASFCPASDQTSTRSAPSSPSASR